MIQIYEVYTDCFSLFSSTVSFEFECGVHGRYILKLTVSNISKLYKEMNVSARRFIASFMSLDVINEGKNVNSICKTVELEPCLREDAKLNLKIFERAKNK